MNKLYIKAQGNKPIKHGVDWSSEEQPSLTGIQLVQVSPEGIALNSMSLSVKEHGEEGEGLPEGYVAMCVWLLAKDSEIVVPRAEMDWRLLFIAMRRYMVEGIDKEFKKLKRTVDAEAVDQHIGTTH